MDERADPAEPTMTQVKIRCREDLKRRLEAEAKAEKRSINDVVISRLEDSYNNPEAQAAMIRSRFGDEKSFKTLCAIASAWDLISSVKGHQWHEYKETIDMATSAAAYAISLLNSGASSVLPDLEDREGEDMRRNLRVVIGYTTAQLAFNTLEGRPFDENTGRRLVADLEELRKFDVVAWYQEEKRAGRVPADWPPAQIESKDAL